LIKIAPGKAPPAVLSALTSTSLILFVLSLVNLEVQTLYPIALISLPRGFIALAKNTISAKGEQVKGTEFINPTRSSAERSLTFTLPPGTCLDFDGAPDLARCSPQFRMWLACRKPRRFKCPPFKPAWPISHPGAQLILKTLPQLLSWAAWPVWPTATHDGL
jgi:hypothetical protein